MNYLRFAGQLLVATGLVLRLFASSRQSQAALLVAIGWVLLAAALVATLKKGTASR